MPKPRQPARTGVRELRANLNQSQAARVVGVHVNTWAKWEQGVTGPMPGQLENYEARALALFPKYAAGAPAPKPGRPRGARNKEPRPKKPKPEKPPFVGPLRKRGRARTRPLPAPKETPKPVFQRDEFIDALFGRKKEKAPARGQG